MRVERKETIPAAMTTRERSLVFVIPEIKYSRITAMYNLQIGCEIVRWEFNDFCEHCISGVCHYRSNPKLARVVALCLVDWAVGRKRKQYRHLRLCIICAVQSGRLHYVSTSQKIPDIQVFPNPKHRGHTQTADMVDYSRFNHIGSDSDSGDDDAPAARLPSTVATPAQRPPASTTTGGRSGEKAPSSSIAESNDNSCSSSSSAEEPGGGTSEVGSLPQPMMMTASKTGKEGRIKFEHGGERGVHAVHGLRSTNGALL